MLQRIREALRGPKITARWVATTLIWVLVLAGAVIFAGIFAVSFSPGAGKAMKAALNTALVGVVVGLAYNYLQKSQDHLRVRLDAAIIVRGYLDELIAVIDGPKGKGPLLSSEVRAAQVRNIALDLGEHTKIHSMPLAVATPRLRSFVQRAEREAGSPDLSELRAEADLLRKQF